MTKKLLMLLAAGVLTLGAAGCSVANAPTLTEGNTVSGAVGGTVEHAIEYGNTVSGALGYHPNFVVGDGNTVSGTVGSTPNHPLTAPLVGTITVLVGGAAALGVARS